MKPLSQMNVIPFIDIMLVMLAIVLITATFVSQGKIPVTLPEAANSEEIGQLEKITIIINAQGEIYYAEKLIDIPELQTALADIDQNTAIVLRVDQETAFQHFVTVIDFLKSHGLNNVSIITQKAPT